MLTNSLNYFEYKFTAAKNCFLFFFNPVPLCLDRIDSSLSGIHFYNGNKTIPHIYLLLKIKYCIVEISSYKKELPLF